jgi:hypothetical protein
MKIRKDLIVIAFVLLIAAISYAARRGQEIESEAVLEDAQVLNSEIPTDQVPSVAVLENYNSVYFGGGTNGELIYDSEEFRISATLPVDALGRPPVEITKAADDAIASFVARNESMRAEFAADGVVPPDLQWQLDIAFDITSSGLYTSYLMKGAEYTGGAHGFPFYQGFTYDDEMRLMQLEDFLVSSEEAAREAFSKEAESVLGERLGEAFFKDGVSPKAVNWQTWYLEDGALNFVFGPYQVGPYSAGRQDLSLNPADFPAVIDVLE